MIERQELYCHNCGKYVQFNLDLSLNGNHVLACPDCRHEHCRVVKDGKITDDRWDQRNFTWYVGTDYASATTSTMTTAGWGYGGTDTASSTAWANSTT